MAKKGNRVQKLWNLSMIDLNKLSAMKSFLFL